VLEDVQHLSAKLQILEDEWAKRSKEAAICIVH
jgi:hypothetical protein